MSAYSFEFPVCDKSPAPCNPKAEPEVENALPDGGVVFRESKSFEPFVPAVPGKTLNPFPMFEFSAPGFVENAAEYAALSAKNAAEG